MKKKEKTPGNRRETMSRSLRPLQLGDIPLPTNITFTPFPSSSQNNNNNNNENISFRSSSSSSSSSSAASSSIQSSSSPLSLSSSSSSPFSFNPAVDALSVGAFTATFNNVTNYNTPDRHAQQQQQSSLFMHSPSPSPSSPTSTSIRYPPSLSSRPSFLNMLSPSLSPSSILNSVSSLNLNIPGVDLNAVDRDISNLNLSNNDNTSHMQSLLENQLNISSPQNSNNLNNSDAQLSYTSSISSSSSSSSSSTPLSSSSTPSSTPQSPQSKLALYFLHPVPNSNLLTVMKCLQPFPQDILIDSRDVSPFLPLLGCFYICTMEEKEVVSIFPMSKPIMRWGVYHKVTRQFLFSAFYRFNCAFGAKGFFTYDIFLEKGHFGFGQEEIFLQQDDVKEKLWKMCISVLRDKFGVNI